MHNFHRAIELTASEKGPFIEHNQQNNAAATLNVDVSKGEASKCRVRPGAGMPWMLTDRRLSIHVLARRTNK